MKRCGCCRRQHQTHQRDSNECALFLRARSHNEWQRSRLDYRVKKQIRLPFSTRKQIGLEITNSRL